MNEIETSLNPSDTDFLIWEWHKRKVAERRRARKARGWAAQIPSDPFLVKVDKPCGC